MSYVNVEFFYFLTFLSTFELYTTLTRRRREYYNINVRREKKQKIRKIKVYSELNISSYVSRD